MTSSPAFSVCVYCGSRAGVVPAYAQVAKEVGHWIGRHQGQLVYGGGNNGLMGLVAQATADAGGRVVGIIPKALQSKENTRTACTELHVVDTMHERKHMMAERADVFLALPGGIGTFEEFFEVWTWRQLGYHDKPVGLLNTEGYYDGLLQFASNSVTQGFLSDWQMDLIRTGTVASELLRELVQAAGFAPEAKLAAL
ncbi:Rossman fold protein, TIGR00730 family [Limnohabitans sp. JirII-29]|uniref:LOG family protein n=1 Tax=unclassified Limnohabitans TaxID=2626134 RepID=UPI000C1EA158|nr:MULTISPECIES: TIGR00730 family Rossman fold protein [unclassified Limnohabitans]PIT80818.1 Rossman fold protein, TIGR00730 family [Limnohabitans sp. JirII-31]PUE28168.1 Rossman fold protein, TIGR00730 family [Limnohabitans sp. JirII-29]